MGVALAWPTSRFTCEEMSISKLADTKQWPRGPKKEKPVENKWTVTKKALGGAWASIRTLWAKPEKRPFDVWHETKRRHNFLATAKLRCKKSGATFAISTYHMPCLFGSDEKVQVMTNHAALAAQEACASLARARLASSRATLTLSRATRRMLSSPRARCRQLTRTCRQPRRTVTSGRRRCLRRWARLT